MQYFANAPLLRVPISLESIDADLARRLSHVGVEDLGEEMALRWRLREVTTDCQTTAEDAIGIGGPNHMSQQSNNLLCRSDDVGLNVGDVAIWVLMKYDA